MIKSEQQSTVSQAQTLLVLPEYVFRLLPHADVESAVDLFIDHFEPNQPLTVAFAKEQPLLPLPLRRNLWRARIQESVKERLVVAVYHKATMELAGVTLSVDAARDLEQDEKVSEEGPLTEQECFTSLAEHFEATNPTDIQELLGKKGRVLEIMVVGVHTEFMGNRLASYMFSLQDFVARKEGYSWVYCQASNLRTAKALKSNKFKKINEIDIRTLAVKGERPFKDIEQADATVSAWVKQIQS